LKQLLLDIQPPAPPKLENFIAGRNAEALHNIQQAIDPASSAIRFIYLWGETGSGKTHLITACQAHNVITVDDVHLLNEADQIDLFNTYNQIRDDNLAGRTSERALIVTGNAPPSHMGLRDDLSTRLAWGLAYQLHPLSDEEKALALRHHARIRGMRLPTEVIDYCLRYLHRDLPNLIATINALDEWSLTTKKPVTVPMLRKLLQLNLEI